MKNASGLGTDHGWSPGLLSSPTLNLTALDNKYQFKGKFKVALLNVSIFKIRRNP